MPLEYVIQKLIEIMPSEKAIVEVNWKFALENLQCKMPLHNEIGKRHGMMQLGKAYPVGNPLHWSVPVQNAIAP
jgi:hypothetical protein